MIRNVLLSFLTSCHFKTSQFKPFYPERERERERDEAAQDRRARGRGGKGGE